MANTNNLHVVLGTGPIGLALITHLHANGATVRAINRSGTSNVPAAVEQHPGDAADPAFVRDACEGATVVYQCLNPPYTQWPDRFPPLQRAAIEGASAAGARLVSMENLYGYGPTGGATLTEDLPLAATGRKGQVRAAMTAELLEAHAGGRVQVAIGRASDYFGPRGLLSAMGERVFYPLIAGKKAQVMGNPDLPHTYSYIPDIARGLATLGERDEALGEVWHLPNPETVTTREFIGRVASALDAEPRIQALPKLLARLIALVNGDVRELLEMWYEFDEPYIVDDSKFRAAFDVSATPLDDAIRDTAAWFQSNPR
jgi:nucleoside-diphosphate-sugar epimerase